MSVKFANNAFGTLNAGINNSATSITLSSGQGARFPALASGDYFYATLIDTSNNLEVVKCTARSTDVLTVTRAQESTTAQAFAIGDRIELRVTAGGLEDVAALATLDADPSPQLSADLDLNSNDITGTGNIELTGAYKLGSTTVADTNGVHVPQLASDPSSPVEGQMYYNTTDDVIYHWNGGKWLQMSNIFTADGGTETTYTDNGINYKSHTFTTSGTFTPNGSGSVDILLVGGGGGGGGGFNNDASGGGGGAGAFRVQTSVSVVGSAYSIVVGGGGTAGPGSGSAGSGSRSSPSGSDGGYGGDTTALGFTANGGGGGTSYEDRVGWANGNASGGGAGGAGGVLNSSGSTRSAGGTYGNSGGLHAGTGQSNDSTSCGGGGGAGGQGGNGTANSTGGNGGIGSQNNYRTGSNVYYAGGGGGGSTQGSQTSGGNGGGGAGGTPTGASGGNNGVSGTANTGGGGGGASSGDATVAGGSGGSGIVVIRYQI